MQKKKAVVLFPGLGMGHLIPTVELAKLFAGHDLSVTILLIDSPLHAPSTTQSFISRVTSAYPLISFHRLPKPQLPPPSPTSSNSSSGGMLSSIFSSFRHSNPLISEFLQTLSQTHNIRALVLDMFTTTALEVGNELRLPTYFFFSSAASSLAVFLFFPTLQAQLDADIGDLGEELLDIPGFHPVPASHMPDMLKKREGEENKVMRFHSERIARGDGIMINTLEELDPRAVRALTEGLSVPGRKMPPVYCIGPLIAEGGGDSGERHECLKWLDGQPKGSVVFLCFGSGGSFSAEQLREMAVGLERSGQRFLWAVRSPRSVDADPAKLFEPLPEPDLSVLMPEGFLERTKGRGMVVKSWAPQTAVLGHEAVGGFVSHCGWNSTLEAVTAGVPIIAWPLYAEQKMNKVFLVEEAKLAVEMRGYDKELVTAEEVEMKVRWLMDSEGGRELRDRMAGMKENAVAAWKDGGSSDKAWSKFVSVLEIHG